MPFLSLEDATLKKNTFGKSLRLEQLETKIPLAADFTLSLVDGDLMIDNTSTTFENSTFPDGVFVLGISGTETPGEYIVGGSPDITFNIDPGSAGAFTPDPLGFRVTGLTDDVFADLGAFTPVAPGEYAAFQFVVGDVNLPGDLEVTGANTEDALVFVVGSATSPPNVIAGDVRFSANGDFGGLNATDTEFGGDLRFQTTGTGESLFVLPGSTGNNVNLSNVMISDDLIVTAGDGDESIVIETTQVNDDARFTLGGGDDVVDLFALNVDDDINLNLGSGDDVLLIDSVTAGDSFYALAGDGGDTVEIGDLEIAKDFNLSFGDGDDCGTVEGLVVGRTTFVSLGEGVDDVTLVDGDAGRSLTLTGRGENTIVVDELTASHFLTIVTANETDIISLINVIMPAGSALISTGGGDDDVSIADSEFKKLIVLLGSGDDMLTIEGVTVHRWAFLSGGSGEDTLNDVDGTTDENRILDFAFEIPEDEF